LETTLFFKEGGLLLKKLLLYGLCATMLLVGASGAGSALIDLSPARGTTVLYDGAAFIEFTEAMQATVSSGTGVIEPFLTIQKKTLETGFNSDASPLVLNTTRPKWNHSLQISDLVSSPIPGYSSSYEFLLDINEPAGGKSLITQHELEVWVVPFSGGGAIKTYSGIAAAGGTRIWDLDKLQDSQIQYDYDLWQGSGQNMDAAFLLPASLFAGYAADSYVYLYAQFGTLNGVGFAADISNFPSEAGFEEYALRESGAPVPEPATMLLLGCGLIGLAGFGRKKLIK